MMTEDQREILRTGILFVEVLLKIVDMQHKAGALLAQKCGDPPPPEPPTGSHKSAWVTKARQILMEDVN